ncbi:MAG: transposase [Candidatus Levybacteria bacterium]|nr:transposase [Candidatus Levybacteria bacterium]
MSKKRKLTFINDGYYHIYNRGIDRRVTYTNKREYQRMLNLLSFYQYRTIPIRYSRFAEAKEDIRQNYYEQMKESGKIIEVIAYCFMPNHFHLLLKQREESGIATYTANVVNAYTKYFNKKYQRTGSLFQGVFKAVYVETDEQLVHLVRYIHLNPVASSLILQEQLDTFPWSSHSLYVNLANNDLIEHKTSTMIKKIVPDYEVFIKDQISYAKELEKIKHMTFEHERVQA